MYVIPPDRVLTNVVAMLPAFVKLVFVKSTSAMIAASRTLPDSEMFGPAIKFFLSRFVMNL